MADYGTLTSSLQDSGPVELYKIEMTGSDPYLWTNASHDVVVSGTETYEAKAVGRDRIVESAEVNNSILKLTLSHDNEFADLYIDIVPANEAVLTVFRIQRDETPAFNTIKPIYQGIVQSVSFEDDLEIPVVNVQSLASALNGNMATFSYTGLCNHFLFGPGCGVDPGAFNHLGEVLSQLGNALEVDGVGASAFNFIGGYCQSLGTSDFRMVVNVASDTLTLQIGFSQFLTGTNVQVFPNCDRAIEGDCSKVFNNTKEHGGYPGVPRLNPFQDGIGE